MCEMLWIVSQRRADRAGGRHRHALMLMEKKR